MRCSRSALDLSSTMRRATSGVRRWPSGSTNSSIKVDDDSAMLWIKYGGLKHQSISRDLERVALRGSAFQETERQEVVGEEDWRWHAPQGVRRNWNSIQPKCLTFCSLCFLLFNSTAVSRIKPVITALAVAQTARDRTGASPRAARCSPSPRPHGPRGCAGTR